MGQHKMPQRILNYPVNQSTDQTPILLQDSIDKIELQEGDRQNVRSSRQSQNPKVQLTIKQIYETCSNQDKLYPN